MNNSMPVHVRATRVARKRRSILLGKTYFAYDVRFKDGSIWLDVKLNSVLQGARYPADYWSVISGAEAASGEGTPGLWVDYPSGRPTRESFR